MNETTHQNGPSETHLCSPNVFHVGSCTDQFDFSLIFEQTALSILPASIYILLGIARAYKLSEARKKARFDLVVLFKVCAAFTLLGLQSALCVLWSQRSNFRIGTSVPASAIGLAASAVICVLVLLEHRCSVRPAGLTTLYLLLSAPFDAAQVRTLYIRPHANDATASILAAIVVTKIILLLLENQSKRTSLNAPYNQYPSEALTGPLSFSFMIWLNKLFRKGWRASMTMDDLFETDNELSSESLTSRMEKTWRSRGIPESRFTLPWAVLRCFKAEMLVMAIPRLCLIGFNYAQPFVIQRAITLLSGPETRESDSKGYGLIAATLLVYIGIAVSTVHYQHRMYRVVTMFRGAMVGLIYNHTLALPDGACPESSAVTLMSTDIDSIIEALVEVNKMWARLIEIGIGLWLLARQLGLPCIVPVLLVLLCTGGQTWVSNRIGNSMKVWNEAVQKRVSVTSSMLVNIKSVKIMGLTHLLSETIQKLRIDELELCKGFMRNILYLNVFATIPTAWSAILTFVAFTIQANVRGEPTLGTAQAFTSLAIISLLSTPATKLLVTLPKSASAMGSFARIQEFLLKPTIERATDTRQYHERDLSSTRNHNNDIELVPMVPKGVIDRRINVIDFKNCSIRPSPDSEILLPKVHLNIPEASFTCIVGPVGSGKSVLLKTILGELKPTSGSVLVAAVRTAYCAQSAWLKNATVRDNTCSPGHDRAIDETWYRSVLHACALEEDIALMPSGDCTLVGTGGITLSGGQRQRLALARALYSRLDLLILDDVMSALDARTAELVTSRIFGKQGLVRRLKTTTVLVTHSLRVLSLADSIVVLPGSGRAVSHGTLQELQAQGLLNEAILPAKTENLGQEREEPEVLPPAGTSTISEQAKLDYTRRVGDMTVYKYYFKSISTLLFALYIMNQIFAAFASSFPQVWLKLWTESGGAKLGLYLPIYIVLAAASNSLVATSIWLMFLRIMPKSAARLHKILLDTVMAAPLSFFSATDSGETLNRFSQDMGLVVMTLPIGLSTVIIGLCDGIFQIGLIATGSSYMAIVIPVILVALYVIQNVYLKTSRQLRLLDLEARSPLYSQFTETIDGVTTIRAFGQQQGEIEELRKRLDRSQRPYYLLYCVQRWLNLVLDLLVAGLAVVVIALAMRLRSSTDAGLLGVALNNILNLSTTLSGLVTSWTTFEISLGAIARVRSFAQETACEIRADEILVPSEDWPCKGAVEVRDVSARHAADLPEVLRNVSMSIAPGQKVGICGRTGSGKSSLLVTLLRLLETTSGTISIDGVDISRMPREIVRQRLFAVPQETFVLAGSVRFNIDPWHTSTDEAIIAALSKVGIWEILETRGRLDAEMSESQLSKGQMQLFSLAKALLSSAKVVLLDEATSDIDLETEKQIQGVLKEEFVERTVLVVAHRIDTILDSDMIAVLDKGELVEYDTPHNLLARNSKFRMLYESS